jgi:predicted ATPase
VETHSDHLINRLIRRIVEDESGAIARLVQMYFIHPADTGAYAEAVQIDPDEGIVNWREGFFDQTANEQELIIKAGLRKRLATRQRAR